MMQLYDLTSKSDALSTSVPQDGYHIGLQCWIFQNVLNSVRDGGT